MLELAGLQKSGGAGYSVSGVYKVSRGGRPWRTGGKGQGALLASWVRSRPAVLFPRVSGGWGGKWGLPAPLFLEGSPEDLCPSDE